MMTSDQLARWEAICQLADQVDPPNSRIRATAVRRWLNEPENADLRDVLLALDDTPLRAALAFWRERYPNAKADKLIPMLVDRAEGRRFNTERPAYPWPGARSCEWCDDGEVLCSETTAIGDYDRLRPCPECNGGQWPYDRRPKPGYRGSYRLWCDEVEF